MSWVRLPVRLTKKTLTYIARRDSALLSSGADFAIVDAVDARVPVFADGPVDDGEVDNLKLVGKVANRKIVDLSQAGVSADGAG